MFGPRFASRLRASFRERALPVRRHAQSTAGSGTTAVSRAPGRWLAALFVGTALLGGSAAALAGDNSVNVAPVPMASVPVLPGVQGNYLTGCGGCHGVQGHSGRSVVPDLAGHVGYFLCTPAGREYLIRLPNVAFANLSSADLATMMNFVVFRLGAGSAPQGAKPYTEEEVARLRAHPFREASLHMYRDEVVRGVAKACPRAADLHDYDLNLNSREVDNGVSRPFSAPGPS